MLPSGLLCLFITNFHRKKVDNTEKFLCLQLEDNIVHPERANPQQALYIQDDIANKTPETDVLNTSDSKMNISKVSETTLPYSQKLQKISFPCA